MNKTMKIVSIVLMAVLMVAVISSTVFAAVDYSNIINKMNDVNVSPTTSDGIAQIAGRIVALIRNIAVVAGVVILSVIGIKFMIGSAEEKAEYKKSLIPLVVGIIVVMAATQIVSMIFGFFA